MITHNEQGQAFWNGIRVPRTTEITKILAPRSWEVDEYYLRKGRLIHLITEWEDSQELDEDSVDPNLMPYLIAYREFKAITGWQPWRREVSFYHEKYEYCGRADAYGSFDTHRWNWVIDIKSGSPHPSDLLQAPAYLFGLKSIGVPVEKCADLYLRKNGTYRFQEIYNPTKKFQEFLGGLRKWREENK